MDIYGIKGQKGRDSIGGKLLFLIESLLNRKERCIA